MATIVTSDSALPPQPHKGKLPDGWTGWLWLLIPAALIIVASLQGTMVTCFSPGSQLLFQAFVPVGALLLAWSRRTDWKTTSDELTALFPDPKSPRRCGNLSVVVVGAVLLLLSQLIALPLLTVLSLWLLLIGVIFYLFGPFLVRAMLTPLLFLLTMTPPPTGLFQGIVARFQLIGAAMTSGILELLGIKTRVQGIILTIYGSGHSTLVTPTLGGVGVFCFVLVSTLCYLAWHRCSLLKSLLILMIAAIITCIGNLVRLATLSFLPRISVLLAELFEGPLAFIPTLLTISGTLYLIHKFSKKLLKNRIDQRIPTL